VLSEGGLSYSPLFSQRMPSLTKDRLVSWLNILDIRRIEERTRGHQEMLVRSLKARMNDSTVAISQRGSKDRRNIFVVGVRLLLTAIGEKCLKQHELCRSTV
jgi:hypothetical protein